MRRIAAATLAAVLAGGIAATPARTSDTPEMLSGPDGSGRLHMVTFNVCDGQGPARIECDGSSSGKALYIKSLMNAWTTHVASFQEICYSTYLELVATLGSGWDGEFNHTYPQDQGDCTWGTSWGLAIFIHAAPPRFSNVTSETLPVYPPPNGENREILCGNVTYFSGFRLCSTHVHKDGPSSQTDSVAAKIDYWSSRNAALILGADMNVNILTGCTVTSGRMNRFYTDKYGRHHRECGPGFGDYYEADNATGYASPDVYEEATTLTGQKLDYIFFNRQRFQDGNYGGAVTGTTISDHDLVKGAMNIHD